ncbi:MAG: DUF1501 domain-containing protein [Candidatus Rokubacteria bacterium]|nr:DUF1501 domain-containing protein [Candidatus Rokubacteria bacterium]
MTPGRRAFLKGGACALIASSGVPPFLVRAAAAAPARRKILVAVFQRGAVDGLSMVPPYGDPAYRAARPELALAPPRRGESATALDLDGHFALHPALAPLMPLWEARGLAVVHACGSPDNTRSHFDAQDYMETGTPGVKSTPDGWLGRTARTLPESRSPLRSVALGAGVPRMLRGGGRALAMRSIERFDVTAAPASPSTGAMAGDGMSGAMPGRGATGFEALYERAGSDPVRGAGRETFEAVRMLKQADAARLPAAHGAVYPRGRFAESLRQIAQLIRADVGLEIAFADVEGWDTHVAQGAEQGQLANRLREFGGALAAFAQDLGDRMSDVLVLTMSEFGRTVAANGSRGTDHGRATAMLVLGGDVRGGKVYGRWPGLARAQREDGRDLAVTTDFRTLFAEVAGRHLGVAQPAALFPGWKEPPATLGLF